jgi:hypothetical protein
MPRLLPRLSAFLASPFGRNRKLSASNFIAPDPKVQQEERQREQQIDRYIDSFIHEIPPRLRMALRTGTSGMSVSSLNPEGVLAALQGRKWRIESLLREYSHSTGAEESFRQESRDIEELKSLLNRLFSGQNEA